MRLEVIIDGEDPKIYPISKSRLVLGSHESCDIVANAQGISRKHLVIVSREDRYFVIDQGSTNGSYINEQRLIPGSSVEFTSFFPIRLGPNVLVSLISDDEAQDFGFDSKKNAFEVQETQRELDKHSLNEDKTKMISLREMQNIKTSKLVKNRQKIYAKKKSSFEVKKKKERRLLPTLLLGSIVFGMISYYHFFILNELPETSMVSEKAAPTPKKVKFTGAIGRVEYHDLISTEQLISLKDNPKCTQEDEKYLCSILPSIYRGKWGVVHSDKFLNIFTDAGHYLALAKKYVRPPKMSEGLASQAELNLYQIHLTLVMSVFWVRDHIPSHLEKFKGAKDYNISVAFFDSKEEEKFICAVAFVPESLLRLREALEDKHFEQVETEGALAFSFALDYLRIM